MGEKFIFFPPYKVCAYNSTLFSKIRATRVLDMYKLCKYSYNIGPQEVSTYQV